MIRKLNRIFQDYMRPKRLTLGKWRWDRKDSQNITQKNQKDIIEKLKIESILFLRYDGKIGDMIINTLMFREIKKTYPNIKIGVVSRGAAISVIKDNPYVDHIYKYDKSTPKIKSLAKEIAQVEYDLLIDFTEMLRVKQMMFINLCKSKYNLGINKKNWRLFDLSLEPNFDFKWTSHITKRYSRYLEKLGIVSPCVDYDLFLSKSDRSFAQSSIMKNKKNIVINPYGASKHKTFNEKTLDGILKFLLDKDVNIIFVYSPDKYKELLSYLEKYSNKITLPKGIDTINKTAAIIELCDLVITPDTSIVHVASAFKKDMICVYPPKGGVYGVDHEVWGPSNSNAKMIFCKDKKSDGDEIDINTFELKEMFSILEKMIRGDRV